MRVVGHDVKRYWVVVVRFESLLKETVRVACEGYLALKVE